jgi:hypothetical protein
MGTWWLTSFLNFVSPSDISPHTESAPTHFEWERGILDAKEGVTVAVYVGYRATQSPQDTNVALRPSFGQRIPAMGHPQPEG